MRIGIITDETDTGDLRSPQTPKQLVGFGTYTINLVKHILLQDKKNEYFLIHRKKEEHEIYKMGAKEIIVPYNPRFPFSTIRNFVTLPLKLRKYRLDVVHHMTITGPFLFKPLMNFKAVETIHELMAVAYPQCFERSVRTVFRLLLPPIAKNSDHIFTAGEKWKAEISKRYGVPPEKISVIYPGSSPEYKPLDRQKCKKLLREKYSIKEPFLLFVSTLEAKKNVTTLLKAYKQLKERGAKHKLVLVGRKGYGYSHVEAAIKELKIENDVIMPGYVPFNDLPAFYNAADIFVFPAYDSFNMTVVDAMKCGCPIVASDGGGAEEGLGGAAILVDVMDVKGYADAMQKIIDNKKLAASLKKKSLEKAKKFSWETAARKTIAVYEQLGKASPNSSSRP